ncbi:MAG: hypothetical protein EBQ92_14300, partial [Proteobacteria bacterium]|nr:hypothetical protein [Pseudomonadota bacterium]
NVSDTFIKNYWVEGVTGHIGQAFAYITQSLIIPELGETTTLTIQGGGFMFTPGQIFFIGSDHRTDYRSCYVKIERVLSENQLEISVVDSPSNAPAGTVIYNGLFLLQPKFDIENSRTTVLRLTSDSDGVITRFNGYNYTGQTSITPNATSIYLYPSPAIRVDDRSCTIKDCVINAGGILLTSGYGQRTEFNQVKLNDSVIENCYFEVIPKNGDPYTIFQNSPFVEAFTCFVIWPGYRGVSAINCHIHSLCSTPQIMMDLIGPYSVIDGCFFDVDVKNPSIELIGDVDYNGNPSTGKYCAMGIMLGNNSGQYANLNNTPSYVLSAIPIVRNCTFKNINKGIAASIYNERGLINIENNNTFINCNVPTDTYVISPSGIGQIYWSTGDQQY